MRLHCFSKKKKIQILEISVGLVLGISKIWKLKTQGSCLSATFFSFGFQTVLSWSQGLRFTFSTRLLYRRSAVHLPDDSPLLHDVLASHLRDLFQDSSSSYTKRRSWEKSSWAGGTVKSQTSGSIQNCLSISPSACLQDDTGKVQPLNHWMCTPSPQPWYHCTCFIVGFQKPANVSNSSTTVFGVKLTVRFVKDQVCLFHIRCSPACLGQPYLRRCVPRLYAGWVTNFRFSWNKRMQKGKLLP